MAGDGQFSAQKADWCADASRTTGLNVAYGNTHSAGLLLIAVDGTVYAIGYGGGHRLIPDELTDPQFGLSFAIRRLDPRQIQDFVRRRPGSRGRTDATSIAAGLPVWTLDVEQHADITCRLGGRLQDMQLTFSSRDNRTVRAEGSAGLRMRLGVEPGDLVSDIREIARICEHEPPHPALEFVEHIRPDFIPTKVVFAILLKKGDQIAASTLFPFPQVTLAHTSRILQSHQIDVEVIGIESVT